MSKLFKLRFQTKMQVCIAIKCSGSAGVCPSPIQCFFSNRDFLPRGSGIVTRRPLILQLLSANTGRHTHVHSCGLCILSFLSLYLKLPPDGSMIFYKGWGWLVGQSWKCHLTVRTCILCFLALLQVGRMYSICITKRLSQMSFRNFAGRVHLQINMA